MRIGRYALACVIAATFATAACTAASGAERVILEPASSSAGGRPAPAAGLLPRIEAGSSGLSVAVDGASEATRRQRDRVAEMEKKAAEEKAQTQEAARQGQAPWSAAEAPGRQGTKQSDGDCAQRAMAAGRFDPSCAAYQGYLDPGTLAGRAPTSGEIQMQFACEQGLVPRSDC